MSAHTAGPWSIYAPSSDDPKAERLANSIGSLSTKQTVASIFQHSSTSVEQRWANARLIAASPDLLSGLKDLFKMMDEQILVRNIEHDHKPEWAGMMMGVVTRLKFAHDAIEKAEGRL